LAFFPRRIHCNLAKRFAKRLQTRCPTRSGEQEKQGRSGEEGGRRGVYVISPMSRERRRRTTRTNFGSAFYGTFVGRSKCVAAHESHLIVDKESQRPPAGCASPRARPRPDRCPDVGAALLVPSAFGGRSRRGADRRLRLLPGDRHRVRCSRPWADARGVRLCSGLRGAEWPSANGIVLAAVDDGCSEAHHCAALHRDDPCDPASPVGPTICAPSTRDR
jgi:hypothetical protein